MDERVFSAALDEIARVGYAGATMDRMAAAAGVAKTTLYRRWPSKAALVVASLSHAFGAVEIVGDDTAAKIESGVRWLAVQLQAPGVAPAFAGVFAEAIVDADTRALLEQSFQRPYVTPLSAAMNMSGPKFLLLADIVAGTLLHRMGVSGRSMTDADIRVLVSMLVGAFAA